MRARISRGWTILAVLAALVSVMAASLPPQGHAAPPSPLPWVCVEGSPPATELRIDQGNGYMYAEDPFKGLTVSKDLGATWRPLRGSVDPVLPLIVTFAVDSRNHYLYAGDARATGKKPRLYVSRDFGASWKVVAGYTPYSALSIRKIVVAPNGNAIVTGHWDGTIFVSTDGGATCRESDQPGTRGGRTVGSSGWGYLGVNPVTGEVWAGLETGGKWVSRDNGLTFTQTASKFSPNVNCGYPGPLGNTYAFGYNLRGDVFESGNHGVWKTADHGATWTHVQPGPTWMGWTEWDGFATDAAGALYISGYDNGGVTGVYRSLDGGSTWKPFGDGLPCVKAPRGGWPMSTNCCLAVNPRDGKLYTAVYWHGKGGGIYRTGAPVQAPRAVR